MKLQTKSIVVCLFCQNSISHSLTLATVDHAENARIAVVAGAQIPHRRQASLRRHHALAAVVAQRLHQHWAE